MAVWSYISPMKSIITLLLILACCTDPDKTFFIQPELKPFYDSFLAEAAHQKFTQFDQIDNLIMVIQPIRNKYTALGLTRKITGGQHFIYIDSDFFDQHRDRVETVVWHELGHCYLDRQHTTNESLMNPNVSGYGWPSDCPIASHCEDYLQNQRNWLSYELFHFQ